MLDELLRAEGLRIHSVAHRVKSRDSVQRKMASEGSDYTAVTDLQDLLGVRIVTFFPDEVDAVAKVIEREFAINEGDSVDKRALLDPDRFGYISLHYIASLDPSRAALTEHQRFADREFEIQVRSILQHAWAEIEHDLGYHTPAALPESMRRRFSRLAGLLEIADDEFQRLRQDAMEHQKSVDSNIARSPESLPLDQDSVSALIRTDRTVREVDDHISRYFAGVHPDEDFAAGVRAADLQAAGFKTIGEVSDALEQQAGLLKEIADVLFSTVESFKNRIHKLAMTRGISLFYLSYASLAESGGVTAILEFADKRGIALTPATAERIVSAYRDASAAQS